MRGKPGQRSFLEGIEQHFPRHDIYLLSSIELNEIHVLFVFGVPLVGEDSRGGFTRDPSWIVVRAHVRLHGANGCRPFHFSRRSGRRRRALLFQSRWGDSTPGNCTMRGTGRGRNTSSS